MIPLPNPIPEEAGCLVRLVSGTAALRRWQCVLWRDGRAWQSTLFPHHHAAPAPDLEALCANFIQRPHHWFPIAPISHA